MEEDENEEEAEDDVQEEALAQVGDGGAGTGRAPALPAGLPADPCTPVCPNICLPWSTFHCRLIRVSASLRLQGAKKGKKAAAGKKAGKAKGSWLGAVAKTEDGCKFYSKAKVRSAGRRAVSGRHSRGAGAARRRRPTTHASMRPRFSPVSWKRPSICQEALPIFLFCSWETWRLLSATPWHSSPRTRMRTPTGPPRWRWCRPCGRPPMVGLRCVGACQYGTERKVAAAAGCMSASVNGSLQPGDDQGTQPACLPVCLACPQTTSTQPHFALAGSKEVQVRLLARGEETVLGDAASDSEVFLTTQLETRCDAG